MIHFWAYGWQTKLVQLIATSIELFPYFINSGKTFITRLCTRNSKMIPLPEFPIVFLL